MVRQESIGMNANPSQGVIIEQGSKDQFCQFEITEYRAGAVGVD
jgi:hypothetical protein